MFRPNAKHASDRRRRRSAKVHDDLELEGIVNLIPIRNLTTIINNKGNSKIVREGQAQTQISLLFLLEVGETIPIYHEITFDLTKRRAFI